MKKTLTYREIIENDNALHAVGDVRKSPTFNLFVAAARYVLKGHCKVWTAAKKPSAEEDELARKKQELWNKYGTPDAKGDLRVFPDKWEEFQSEVEKLKKESTKIEADIKESHLKLEEMLDSVPQKDGKDVELIFEPIPKADLPKELTGNQLAGIMLLIK